MACLFTDSQQLANALKNRELISRFNKNTSTQEQIVEMVDFIDSAITKPKGHENDRYSVGTHTISGRVTDKVTRMFEKGKTIEQIKQAAIDYQYALEVGDLVHMANELAGKALLIDNEAQRTSELNRVKQLVTSGLNGYKLSPAHFNIIAGLDSTGKPVNTGVRQIIKQIRDKQRIINKLNGTNGQVQIRFEATIVNPSSDEAGTIDVLAIYSDKTADIFDYKTITSPFDKLENIKPFSRNKKKGFRMQMSSYRKTLIDHYGVEKVNRIRIVPVFVQLEMDKETKKFTKNVKKVLMGEGQHEKLSQIPLANETTGFVALDKMVSELFEKRKSLYDANKHKEAEVYDEQIQKLLVSKDYAHIISLVHSEAKEFAKRMDNNERLDSTHTQMIKALNEFLQGFKNEFDQAVELELVEKENDFLKEYQEEIDLIQSVFYRASTYFAEQYGSEIEVKKLGHVERQDGKILIEDRDNFLEKSMVVHSELESPILKLLREKVEGAQHKTEKKVREHADKLTDAHDKVTAWMRQMGLSHLGSVLMDSQGMMIRELSSEFYKDKSKAIKMGDVEWLVQHLQPKENYTEQYKKYYDDQKEWLINHYAYIKDPSLRSQRIQKDLERFEAENNLSLDTKGMPKFPLAWGNVNRSWLQPTSLAKQKYKTQEWAYAEQHEPLMNYIKTVYDINRSIREDTNLDYYTLPDNFLPWVRKELMDRVMESDNKLQAVFGYFKEKFETNADDQGFGAFDEDGERLLKGTIPIFFLNPFTKANGSLDIGEKSVDFTKSMLIFLESAYNYKFMGEIEADILTIRDLMNNNKIQNIKRSPRGKTLMDDFGKKFGFNLDNTMFGLSTGELYDVFVDKYLYGLGVKPVMLGSRDITKKMLELKNFHTLNSLGLGILPGIAAGLGATSQAVIEGFKGTVYTSGQFNEAVTSLKTNPKTTLAMYHFFGVGPESISGRLSVSKKNQISDAINIGDKHHSDTVKKFISTHLMMSPFRTTDAYLEAVLTKAMSKNYMVNIETGEIRLKKRKSGQEGWYLIEDVFSYENDQISIKHVKEEALDNFVRSFRKAVRSVQYRIKGTISHQDAAYFQSNLITNLFMQFRTWMPGVVSERGGELTFKSQIDAMTYGRYRALYDEFSKDVKEPGGGIVGNFANFMMKGAIPAMKELSKDLILGTLTLGKIDSLRYTVRERYKSDPVYKNRVDLWIEKFKQLNPFAFEQVLEANDNDYDKMVDELLETREKALRALVGEVRILAVLLSMVAFLGGDHDDDGQKNWKENLALRNLYRVTNRLITEMSFAYNPEELKTLTRGNIIPLVTLVDKTWKLGEEIFDFTIRESLLGLERPATKKHTMLSRLYRLFPGLYQLGRLFEITEIDKQSSR